MRVEFVENGAEDFSVLYRVGRLVVGDVSLKIYYLEYPQQKILLNIDDPFDLGSENNTRAAVQQFLKTNGFRLGGTSARVISDWGLTGFLDDNRE